MMRRLFLCGAVAAAMAASAAVAAPVSFTADLNKLMSRLQAMGHGTYSEADWKQVYIQLGEIETRAREGEAWDALVETRLVHAMVLGDMQKNYKAAIDVLQETRREMRGRNVPQMKRVFVKLAELNGRTGDETSVNRVIEEFRASPYYDPQEYSFSGGQGPQSPLAVMRPNVTGGGSISETAMKVAQTNARFAPGAAFPEFELTDAAGVKLTRQSLAGKVVLFDFWHKDWTAWKVDLPNLAGAYQRYNKQGFEIVGISIDPAAGDPASFTRANRMTWPQAADARDLSKQLGIFGECSNYLVDGNGIIIARNLRGADLIEAVKRALAK